jgi:hypothetical protein
MLTKDWHLPTPSIMLGIEQGKDAPPPWNGAWMGYQLSSGKSGWCLYWRAWSWGCSPH